MSIIGKYKAFGLCIQSYNMNLFLRLKIHGKFCVRLGTRVKPHPKFSENFGLKKGETILTSVQYHGCFFS